MKISIVHISVIVFKKYKESGLLDPEDVSPKMLVTVSYSTQHNIPVDMNIC